MNIKLLFLPLLAALPLSALAASPLAASTTIRCASPDWPTQAQVARYLESPAPTDDASGPVDAATADEVRLVSRHIREQGRLSCARGATHVRLDFYAAPG